MWIFNNNLRKASKYGPYGFLRNCEIGYATVSQFGLSAKVNCEMENETIGDRIKQLAKRLGSVAALAELTGIPKRSLDDYIGKIADVKSERLAVIVQRTGVDAAWLLTGDGTSPFEQERAATYPSHQTTVLTTDGKPPPFEARERDDDFVKLPLYDLNVSAGAGAWNDAARVKTYLAFRRDWLLQTVGSDSRELALVSVSGDSMSPTIPHGAVVMIEPALIDGVSDGIHLMMLNGRLVIKRLQRLEMSLAGDGRADVRVSVISDNRNYQPLDVWITAANEHENHVIGRAVWMGARL